MLTCYLKSTLVPVVWGYGRVLVVVGGAVSIGRVLELSGSKSISMVVYIQI